MRSILFFVCVSLCLTGAVACRDRSAAAIAAPVELTKAIKVSSDSSYYIIGQLAFRAIRQEIHFPPLIVRNGEDVVATASLTIDDTKWGSLTSQAVYLHWRKTSY
jgi:hypothetical protein